MLARRMGAETPSFIPPGPISTVATPHSIAPVNATSPKVRLLFRVWLIALVFGANDERMPPYQRGRTSITGLMVKSNIIIETGQLVGVVMTRLVLSAI